MLKSMVKNRLKGIFLSLQLFFLSIFILLIFLLTLLNFVGTVYTTDLSKTTYLTTEPKLIIPVYYAINTTKGSTIKIVENFQGNPEIVNWFIENDAASQEKIAHTSDGNIHTFIFLAPSESFTFIYNYILPDGSTDVYTVSTKYQIPGMEGAILSQSVVVDKPESEMSQEARKLLALARLPAEDSLLEQEKLNEQQLNPGEEQDNNYSDNNQIKNTPTNVDMVLENGSLAPLNNNPKDETNFLLYVAITIMSCAFVLLILLYVKTRKHKL